MEHQCLVRDASLGKAKAGGEEARSGAVGYWVLGAVLHWQEQGRILSPLMLVPLFLANDARIQERMKHCWQKAFFTILKPPPKDAGCG